MKKAVHYTIDQYSNLEELTQEDGDLLQQAKQASSSAYAPYSNFKVGSAVLLSSGEIVTGSNQENVAYPAGLCAERVALFAAKANYPDGEIRTIAISGDNLDGDIWLTPCGSCRQVMLESSLQQSSEIKVICEVNPSTILVFESCELLLPHSFKNSNLKKD